MPHLSIITINRNNAPGLQKTIDSVFAQTFKNFEYIIIDGGSTDGSLAVIESVKDKTTYWVSEQDKGIYNGMNKGITQAKGAYLFFLNSGDCFASEQVLQQFFGDSSQRNADVLAGNVIVEGHVKKGYEKISLFKILEYSITHQSLFLKRSLFTLYGYYDESYPINADINHLILCLTRHNASYLYKDINLCIMEPGGISSIDSETNKKLRKQFMEKEFPMIAEDYIALIKYKRKDIPNRVRNMIGRKLKF